MLKTLILDLIIRSDPIQSCTLHLHIHNKYSFQYNHCTHFYLVKIYHNYYLLFSGTGSDFHHTVFKVIHSWNYKNKTILLFSFFFFLFSSNLTRQTEIAKVETEKREKSSVPTISNICWWSRNGMRFQIEVAMGCDFAVVRLSLVDLAHGGRPNFGLKEKRKKNIFLRLRNNYSHP